MKAALVVLLLVITGVECATELGSFAVGKAVFGVQVKGNVVFVIGPGAPKRVGVEAWDVANASAPTLLGEHSSPMVANHIGAVLKGDLLFVLVQVIQTGCCNGLQILNVSDPSTMREVSWVDLGGGEGNLTAGHPAMVGDVVYIASRGGVHRVDVSDPSQPARLPTVLSNLSVDSVSSEGPLLYVAASKTYVYRAADLTPVGVLDHAWIDAVDRSRGVLCTQGEVFDFWNGTTLARLGSFAGYQGGVTAFDAADGMLFAGFLEHLTLVDYADVASPRIRDTYTSSFITQFTQTRLAGNMLVAAGHGGVALLTGF